MIRAITASLLCLFILCGRAQALENLDTFPRSTLQIHTGAGLQRFNIWVADTPARAEQGLMFVRSLPLDQGMLFPMGAPQVVRMWMHNTLIPLDMLFIAADGRIVYIRAMATPLSDAIISTDRPVTAVLELFGGEAAHRHIRVGNRVQYSLPK